MPYVDRERKRAHDAAYRAVNREKIHARWAAYRAANPEKLAASRAAYHAANPEYRFRRHLQHQYGITADERAAMVTAQGGRCGVCGKRAPKLVVDHLHLSAVELKRRRWTRRDCVAGLVCGACNHWQDALHVKPARQAAVIAWWDPSNWPANAVLGVPGSRGPIPG